MAAALGVSENTISFTSTGKTQPRFELLKAMADYLEVDIRELFISTKETDQTKQLEALKKIRDISNEIID